MWWAECLNGLPGFVLTALEGLGWGGGGLETLMDSEENEKAKGWEVEINIYKYRISCVYRVFMN